MDVIQRLESESINIHLSVISILLVAILILFIIAYRKSYNSQKGQLLVCYMIMGISSLSFSVFKENSLIGIMASLYASCVFAILHSRLKDIENRRIQESIKGKIEDLKNFEERQQKFMDDFLQEFDKKSRESEDNQKKFRDEFLQKIDNKNRDSEANQKTFRDEIIREIDKINKGFLYKHDKIFTPNKNSEPDEELFKELVEGIKLSRTYIYEGEDAIKSSACLYCIKKELRQKTERLKATFIFDICNKEEATQEYAINFFTSLFLLKDLCKDGCFGELIVVLRKNQTRQFVNLMDSQLFYSPYPKSEDKKRYPITFLYTPKGNEQSFFGIFKNVMNNILNEDGNKKIQLTNKFDNLAELNFLTYARCGYFGSNIKCFKKSDMRFSNNAISEYFAPLIKERLEVYSELIERYRKVES